MKDWSKRKDWDKTIKTPYLAVDAVVMDNSQILFVKRKNVPFIGYWALPGGFVERGETLRKTAAREVLEETGLTVVPEKIVGIYDGPDRDPIRGHVVTVTFLCRLKGGKLKPQQQEVKEARFFPISEISKLKMAFDHRKIISDALKIKVAPAVKVLAGGTFNIIHPGHILFLEKARSLGDYLVVVVASDSTVLKRKSFLTMDAGARKRVVESLRMVDKAVIGDEKDFLKVVREERPDIIALGYDQDMDEADLARKISKMGIKCKIIRIKSSLKRYKTGKIIRRLK